MKVSSEKSKVSTWFRWYRGHKKPGALAGREGGVPTCVASLRGALYFELDLAHKLIFAESSAMVSSKAS